jgi:hypothetical protein
MTFRTLAAALCAAAFGLAACGGSDKVDTASYTCGQFNKSLKTKGDNTSGAFINQLRKDAKLGQAKQTEVREITLGIFFACRGKPASTKPADEAVATAKKIRAGKFKLPSGTGTTEKKSDK